MPGIFWGMWRKDIDTGGDTTVTGQTDSTGATYPASADVEASKRPSVVVVNRGWYSGGYITFSSFSSWYTTIRNHGQIPLLNWSISVGASTPQGTITLANIAAGTFDSAFLTPFATAIAALGYPVMIMLGEEINLSGNPWFDATGTNYVAMYKHVVDTFDAAGATNVSWTLDINGIAPGGTISRWWPGNKANGQPYVHWVLMDVFNTAVSSGSTWITFDNIISSDATGQWGNTLAAVKALDTTGQVRLGIGSFGSEDRLAPKAAPVNNYAQSATWLSDAFGVQLPNGSGAARDNSWCEMVLIFDENEPDPSISVDPVQHWNVGGNPMGTNTARQAAFQGPDGPGSNAHYVAGGQFLLPSGMGRIYPYHGNQQESALMRAVLQTAPTHLKGYWRLNETSGTAAADSSGNSAGGTYTAGFTLAQQRIALGSLDSAALFNGSTGYVLGPTTSTLDPLSTGKQTICAVFQMAALPAAFGTLAGRNSGVNYAAALRVSSTGVIEGHWWNAAGADYSTYGSSAAAIAVGTTYVAFWAVDNAASPIGRLRWAALGSTTLLSGTGADTLANTPTLGAGTTFDIGRRGDNVHFANALISHVAVWNVALSDVSMLEILKAANVRRDKPRGSVVG